MHSSFPSIFYVKRQQNLGASSQWHSQHCIGADVFSAKEDGADSISAEGNGTDGIRYEGVSADGMEADGVSVYGIGSVDDIGAD